MMKRILLTVALVVFCGSLVNAAEWQVDAVHSKVQFKVSHLVISKIVGSFGEFSATMNFDGKDIAAGDVEFSVVVASIDTDNADRDGHLAKPEFFDTEKFPAITFKSNKVVKGDGGKFQLIGAMTMKGVTKEVTFDCEFHGSAEFMGTTKSGFSATTKIDRQEFGLSFSATLDAGGVIVGNEVEISLELEFNQAK